MPDARFAIVADNVVIDRVGRIQSREAFANDLLWLTTIHGPTNHSITQMGAYYVTALIHKKRRAGPMCVVGLRYIFGDLA